MFANSNITNTFSNSFRGVQGGGGMYGRCVPQVKRNFFLFVFFVLYCGNEVVINLFLITPISGVLIVVISP